MQRKLLFFDDQPLERRDNVERRLGRPRLIPESVYRDPSVDTSWAYPTVFCAPEGGRWRMLYMGYALQGTAGRHLPLVAESDDGLHWRPRDTTADVVLEERRLPHQVGIALSDYGEWSQPFLDERADPAERLKGLVMRGHGSSGETSLWVSAEGLRWKRKEDVRWQEGGPDPVTSACWNELRQTYVLTSRPSGSDRRMAIFETKDWSDFTAPELALAADPLDAPLSEVYGMPVFAYDQYFVALVQLYHTIPQTSGWKFFDGHVDCQLAYSLNGWRFQRSLREPFIANGDPDQPHAGCLYPTSLLSLPDGSIRIYAGACTREHGHHAPGIGSVVAFSLREDGFTFLESRNGVGVVGTRPLLWNGGRLQANVQSQNGCAKVQIVGMDRRPLEGFSFDESIPFSGDDVRWEPAWASGATTESLAGQPVRFEIEMLGTRLYALRGDFRGITQHDASLFHSDGRRPPDRTGFF